MMFISNVNDITLSLIGFKPIFVIDFLLMKEIIIELGLITPFAGRFCREVVKLLLNFLSLPVNVIILVRGHRL